MARRAKEWDGEPWLCILKQSRQTWQHLKLLHPDFIEYFAEIYCRIYPI